MLPRNGEVCALATPRRTAERACLPLDRTGEQCLRVILARSDAARAYVADFSRTVELSLVLAAADPFDIGPEVVALPSPDAAPAAGQVGVWLQGGSRAVAVLDSAGVRRFARVDGGVFSTNVEAFVDIADLTLF
ncbi:hypothetical protein DVA67_019415 [Solirubrobacter sp. CPCC 204708]|uniref:Uncharacterized protein n=1 Tax=Solirubrobacter deserti TaxID=2282478 RepID=A0ABT4RGL2_9ACTN|nr:hypothetical protein [Solirubrobacter deserti]MBE2318159.1 hypothetical protein [Solirubrobacter deserti]MDA0137440.1 hypothetical protein [Solirubrobacter deserti]